MWIALMVWMGVSKKDISLHNNYSKKDTKDFFKKVKLKPKHIKN